MSRKILCEKCGVLKPMHPEDVLMGFKRRRVQIGLAKKPDGLDVKIYEDGKLTERKILRSLFCDNCGEPIADGAPAIAETFWRGEDEPAEWESEYMTADYRQ